MFFAYLSFWLFTKDKWAVGCFVYSFAVGIKMNVLLFAPGLFLLMLHRLGIFHTIKNLTICATVQVLLGLPFLLDNAVGYISRSFNLGRVFIYFWSVNWQFIPEDIFVSKEWGLGLLALTAFVDFAFFFKRWMLSYHHLNKLTYSNPITLNPSKENLDTDCTNQSN